MKLPSLDKLLEDCLKDLYSAENQLVKALPKMAKASTSPALKKAFADHLEQTRGQVERLTEAGEQLGIKLTGKKCAAMEGLIEEAKELLEADADPAVLDMALAGAAQKVEHYEISGYGTARTLAGLLGQDRVAELLQETLDEEKTADELLTQVCLNDILPEAEAGEEEDEEEAEAAPAASRGGRNGRAAAAGKTRRR
ncbi:MAG: ferritin-like domain-containing protein [Gemmataceae bacterium]